MVPFAGVFDITVKATDVLGLVGGRNEFADFLKTALEQQLGLKMERRKISLDTVIVDRGNRLPVEN